MSERDMADLQALLERRLGKSWVEIVAWLQTETGLEEISRAITTQDFTVLLQTVRAGAERFAADVHDAYVTAGQAEAKWLAGELDAVVRFDVANPRAVAWAQSNKLEFVREITNEQRAVLRIVLADGIADGRNPLDVAREIQGSIGLTEAQAEIVQNWRGMLEAGEYRAALGRELADGRYEQTLAAAVRHNRTLTDEQIDRMVDAYRKNFIALRAETIARTEGLRVLHQGTEEMLRQAIDAGDITVTELEREWHHSNVGKYPRPGHEHMRKGTAKLGEVFVTGDGIPMRYPGDPNAPASEVINCRCVVSTVIA